MVPHGTGRLPEWQDHFRELGKNLLPRYRLGGWVGMTVSPRHASPGEDTVSQVCWTWQVRSYLQCVLTWRVCVFQACWP